MDYKRTKEYLPRVHRTRQMDEELRESYCILEKRLFHEGRIVTPSFISENNMLPFFQAIGWEFFFKENFFCSIDKRSKVKACTAYMLCYLTIGRKFNFTSMIIYRMEEVTKKRKGPMPFSMLLTRLYNHILATNPQAIVPIARFTFHEHVMDPLEISRNPSTQKGKKIASPLVISSSSSSSNDNKASSFLEFYDQLSDSENLTKA
uniref:Uncharacterized protein n=1 Tax=Tanacetum cinerariifolium TaxID=118510 RepID=A0A6L2LT74_TANCI|nr:hypothetical protein [Tanacetum cinerariifolium]